jgi:DNA-binding LytR/AlgR family response regulator
MNILICDDNKDVVVQEEFVIEEAMAAIKKCGNIKTFTLAKDCMKHIQENKNAYEIIFLDIEMPYISGIEMAKKIKEINPFIQIIFVTSFEKYSLSAYEAHPFHYVVKPLQTKKVMEILQSVWEYEKAGGVTSFDTPKIKVESNRDIISIPTGAVCYIEKEKNICHIVTKTKEYNTYISLKELENQISDLKVKELYRCHQSFIVNLSCIQSYEGREFVLENGMCIPISRGKRTEAKKRFYDMLREVENICR